MKKELSDHEPLTNTLQSEIRYDKDDLGIALILRSEMPFGLKPSPKENLTSNIEIALKDKVVGRISDGQRKELWSSFYPIIKKRVKYIIPDNDAELFYGIEILDIAGELYFVKGSKTGVFYDKNRFNLIIPFSCYSALSDSHAKPKYFYSKNKKFPYEVVSAVSKNSVRRLVVNGLRKIFKDNNFAYVHLWYYPKTFQTVFIFRVDGDFATKDEIIKTINFFDKKEIRPTFFVDVKRSENYLALFKDAQKMGFDVQLHCYAHNLYSKERENYENIALGKKMLEKINLSVIGFAAPFGKWNYNLNTVLEKLNFSYSSEFAYAYDDLPLFPIIGRRFSSVLQVPVHPICINRLLHRNFKKKEIVEYYIEYVRKCFKLNLPIIFYDHPKAIIEATDVYSEVLNYVTGIKEIGFLTFSQFADWWQKRWLFLEEKLDCEDAESHWHIIFPDGSETFLPAKKNSFDEFFTNEERLANLLKKKRGMEYALPKDIRNIRKNEWLLKFKHWLWKFNIKRKGVEE